MRPGGEPCLFYNEPVSLGRFLIILGLVLVGAGALVTLGGKFSFFGLGRLPGDIVWRRKNFVFYFPVATSILLSVLLTLLFWVFRKR